ncbi:spore germination protein GerPC [Oceanobacillus halophilus]|uniref:Uncharacterized protein n=1 Tax=Oceanobacillus halophilus TaxID=930130 RepID=A0A494ZXS8_9BACI|nr:spore germination protein GerPC [Oceanobacillus halophilus]RKQ31308.1 hypothetical protein D8M06_14645 [Oceanobacillus halophilus]
MYGNDWNQFMYEMQQRIQQQTMRIQELEERVRTLEEAQQNSKSTNIEKIEYKFDQLKIETLSGSLHIGLTPDDLKNMEDLTLGQQTQLNPTNSMSPFDQQLTRELQQWFQSSGPPLIQDLANQYRCSIDESHQSMLLQDVLNQFPERIRFYKDQASSTTNEKELKEYILNHIKEEIYQSLSRYMKNNKGEEKNEHGNS